MSPLSQLLEHMLNHGLEHLKIYLIWSANTSVKQMMAPMVWISHRNQHRLREMIQFSSKKLDRLHCAMLGDGLAGFVRGFETREVFIFLLIYRLIRLFEMARNIDVGILVAFEEASS